MLGSKKLKLKIELTPKETELCHLLKEVVKTRQLKTTMRIAGGWVRDKLLGSESGDIDIALDDMMGKEFAEHVMDHLKSRGVKTGSVGVIKVNPDQSKHLETATANLLGVWVDFVNLRSESYESESRIPDKITFGTPSQDAHRRDITINSLFYNINDDRVEDYTQKGISDLQEGIIRTPLDPIVTFSDDPLRCLRVIRFASRFGFQIEPGTFDALQSDISRNGVKNKISRERIGKEIDKMFRDSNGYIATNLLQQTRLFDVVFQRCPPNAEFGSQNVTYNEGHLSEQVNSMMAMLGWNFDQEERRYAFLSAALFNSNDTFLDKKQKPVSQANYIVLESLKLPNKDGKAVSAVLESLETFRQLAGKGLVTRKELGLALKKPAEYWRITLLLVALTPQGYSQDKRDWEERCKHLAALVNEYRLDGCWNDKPLINGKEILGLLELPAGPILGQLIQDLLEWQLEHPEATPETARAWVLEQKK